MQTVTMSRSENSPLSHRLLTTLCEHPQSTLDTRGMSQGIWASQSDQPLGQSMRQQPSRHLVADRAPPTETRSRMQGQ